MMITKRVQEGSVPVVEHRLPARNLDEREHHVLWSLGASVYRWQVVLPRESCAKRLDVSGQRHTMKHMRKRRWGVLLEL